ncbi:MAG: hypothetical protein ABFD08_07880, partial [Syntrophomonas sp.]
VHVARPLELARLRWAFLPCFANICFHIYASLIRKPGVFQGELLSYSNKTTAEMKGLLSKK